MNTFIVQIIKNDAFHSKCLLQNRHELFPFLRRRRVLFNIARQMQSYTSVLGKGVSRSVEEKRPPRST